MADTADGEVGTGAGESVPLDPPARITTTDPEPEFDLDKTLAALLAPREPEYPYTPDPRTQTGYDDGPYSVPVTDRRDELNYTPVDSFYYDTMGIPYGGFDIDDFGLDDFSIAGRNSDIGASGASTADAPPIPKPRPDGLASTTGTKRDRSLDTQNYGMETSVSQISPHRDLVAPAPDNTPANDYTRYSGPEFIDYTPPTREIGANKSPVADTTTDTVPIPAETMPSN